MKRTAAIGLLMICSEGLLCVFLVTWLLAQWRSEEQNLRKDLQLKFNTVTQRVTDSVIKSHVGPAPKEPGGKQKKFRLMVSGDRPMGELSSRAQIRPRILVHRSTWSNGHDSMTMEERDTSVVNVLDGVQIVLGALLPDSMLQNLSMRDTGGVRRHFLRMLADDRQHFSFRYVSPKAVERSGQIVLHGEGMNRLFTIMVGNYYPFLLRKLLAQVLFALALVAITALGFYLALRSLQRERKLSQMKNSLVSNMSHELKTPVTTVKVALEALGEEAVLQDRYTTRTYIGMATQELQRLELLVNSTLHTSLLESGKLAMQTAPVDLQALVESLIASLGLRFQKQHATVSLAFAAGEYVVSADKLHVQGVLLNILDNALKYGGEGVRIDVFGASDERGVTISISDNGPGIPKGYQRQIFEKFFRVPTGNLHLVKGYGLGLSYAAEVMRLHSGSITVVSEAAGGSTFQLHFLKN